MCGKQMTLGERGKADSQVDRANKDYEGFDGFEND